MIQWYSLLASKTASLSQLERAGRWFLLSGIQEADGGVARYYLAESDRNAPISTEITGYAASVLVWLYDQTGDSAYLDAAIRAARYLTRTAWDINSATFPFEIATGTQRAYSYFFDNGIVIRGLLAAWRATGEGEFLERAKDAAVAMAFDFHAAEAVHPILALPEKEPLDYEPRWSRSPGCYQLKSAMAWLDVAAVTGQHEIAAAYERMLVYSLSTHSAFLPGDERAERVMDRLHAYCYFLEALLPVAARLECKMALAEGMQRVGSLLRLIAPVFVRSDVYAQLLRVRLFAHELGAVPLDFEAAAQEAERAAGFQCNRSEERFDGGYWFGRKGDALLPFINPVSTAFCAQALTLWEQFQAGGFTASISALV